jgi:hypothetical protein
MAVYITRQSKEVLLSQTPEVKVSQQYVMVLQCPETAIEESANNVMAMTQNVVASGIPLRHSVESTMTLSDDTVTIGFLNTPASSTLAMVDVAVAVRDLPVSVGSTMTLTSLGGRTVTVEPETDLFLISLALYFNLVADRNPVGNTMVLTQQVELQDTKFVEHDLGLVQTVDIIFPVKPDVIQVLSLTQHTSTPYHFWVEDIMSLTQFVPTPLTPQFVEHTMNLVQDSPIGLFEDVITFTQSVAFSFSLTASNVMDMTDNLVLQADWVRDAEHANIIGHALTWYEDTPCGRKQYSPFQGENTIPLDVSPPSDNLQDPQGDTGNFSLYQPYLGVPSSEVILRKPEMDNRDRNAYTRVNHETRGGKIIVYADPTWPTVRTLAVTIIGLTETQVDELQSFMQDTLGQEIGLTDWEGRLWKGFIPNPNEPATQDGRNMWTVSFEFQGEALDVEQPGNEDGVGMVMNLSQSVTAVIV